MFVCINTLEQQLPSSLITPNTLIKMQVGNSLCAMIITTFVLHLKSCNVNTSKITYPCMHLWNWSVGCYIISAPIIVYQPPHQRHKEGIL